MKDWELSTQNSIGSAVAAADTISSPWTPASSGPPPDANGSGSDTKNLDVGDISDDEKDLSAADAEGVWSPDIEQSFQEALTIYPPCGRRKIILSDEGKMYGRNELIARYIKLRTGKTRTRKQVSSHIQVLARRKLREIQAKLKVDHVTKEKTLQTMSSMSSAQIVSAGSVIHNKMTPALMGTLALHASTPSYPGANFWQPGLQPGTSQDVKPFSQPAYTGKPATAVSSGDMVQAQPPPPWEGRSIATHKLRLVEFSAYMDQHRDQDIYHKHLFVHIGGSATYTDPLLEAVDVRQIYDKFPEKKGGLKELYDKGPQAAFFLVKFWADLNTNIQDEAGAFYGVTSQYESTENMTITCSTKVCSFGKQVVEKVETEYARFENGRFVYRISRSPMCEYMINFIHKLKHLPEKYMMNSVLENFTILQIVTNRDTQETLLCTAYVFEVSTSEHGAQHHIYKLVKD
ncbi:transcriptional enhancer factor TEF-1 isoform X1 [Microplitis mediator]|uniref:transcriptional enhancer factor TEF-1 isoform X1 n=1 Tax=Microplitis demolitor TaxID=69319 RepID=UPI0004CCF09D|nr:transcriptional enhancer factor TEF-1 isoform X1 [Microplitis demolitor]XP_008548187.1 transcriptional enhancer factor TEF-1 isoform X1 [Microplitis demolitor]XP_008548189.1 transcriptional enhancer factor TEF-1 isoform X1 [Microplitis demolitor]XP_053598206.1 transcriptional enhancer factor TEF-1 isoform X1 [Microplitis demolitor]XP_057339530.1 transcriptional enhancer factor TEF-1 isoform X1 [Microplitis mediator]XP_057339532.1 transcriptional enhancer factor TEF-1 isoform X1 [Microplitis